MRQSTLLKIIGLLRTHLDQGLTIREIALALKIGYRPAYMHIREMEKQNIISVQKIGNAKQCKLNTQTRKTIILLTESDIIKTERIPLINTLLKNILDIKNISAIILFGSYARGEQQKGSDIDIIILLQDINDLNTRNIITKKCGAYKYSHNITINPIFIDIKELLTMLKSKELNIGIEAKNYGIILYGAELFWNIINE